MTNQDSEALLLARAETALTAALNMVEGDGMPPDWDYLRLVRMQLRVLRATPKDTAGWQAMREVERKTMVEFNGRTYPHIMIAERQREVYVAITALQMMQEHHGNKYLSFKCVRQDEEDEWLRKADAEVPKVIP